MKLYRAKIIKNDPTNAATGIDKTKNGRVQIYIEAYHRDISSELYPWALPAKDGTGGSSSFGVSCIPEIGSFVWVFFEDEEFHRNPFYVWDFNPSGLNPHNLYESNVKSTVGSASSYPDVKYIYLKNGICIAVSSNASNPEITIYHPSASMFVDKSGIMTIKSNGHEIIIGTNIDVKPKAGTFLNLGASPTQPCNNLPACLFTGAVHSTSADVKA